MPLLKLQTSVPVAEAKRDTLSKALSQITASAIGKPESYMMVALSEGPICMGGEVGPGAFVDIRSIGGLEPAVNKTISGQVCELLTRELEIPGNRIYLSFTNVTGVDWGWNGGTFG